MRRRIRFSISLVLLTFTMTFIISTNAMQTKTLQTVSVYQVPDAMGVSQQDNPQDTLNTPAHETAQTLQETDSETQYHSVNHTVKSGETLSDIIQDYGFIHEFKHILAMGKKDLKKLSNLKTDRPIELLSKDKSLQKITYHSSVTQRIIVAKQEDGGFQFIEETLPVDKSTAYVSASIENSLYLSGKKAGMSDKLVIEMATILGWDIDFAYDIRDGDYFTLIHEEEYLQGAKISDGKILALHFFNAGKHYYIVRYHDKNNRDSYYTLEGKNVRKAFLRSPLDFAYISSHFNLKRMHPVLHKARAHKGVDYAARRGTPIRASGDGKIVLRKRYGGYGKTVMIQHGRTYKTLYAHMSRFSKNQRLGSYIKQGRVIGYVGSTGLSTGPHLHYEFHVNGVARNPLKVKLPDAKALAKSEMPRFRSQTQRLRHQLNLLTKAHVASLPSPKNTIR